LTQFAAAQRLGLWLGQGWLQMQTGIEAQAVEYPDQVSQLGVVEAYLKGVNTRLTTA
jgi:hypothetical protein